MESSERIPTNLRTLLILEIIAGADRPLSPTEVAREMGLPKQTVHRLCTTLAEEGYIYRERPGNRLRPARRLRRLCGGILQASRYHIARHQVLVEVALQVGETVNFVMPEDDGMSYVDRVETDWPFRVQLPVGSHVPFHCTASGKVFLANLPKAARQKLIASIPLNRETPNTITDPDTLEAELKQVARQGYALDREEFKPDMVAIAVPVRDDRNRFHAVLAFHGPKIRLSVDKALERRVFLEKAAEKLRRILFENEDQSATQKA